MAAAIRTRNAYSPVSADDTGQDGTIRRAGSRISVSKPARGISCWIFSLLIIGVCVLFLLGFCLGFYVRESQSTEQCGNTQRLDDSKIKDHHNIVQKPEGLASIHENIIHFIHGEELRRLLQELGFHSEDPVTDSLVERNIEQRVRQHLQENMFDGFDVEEHDVALTYCDPSQPNLLQLLQRDNTTARTVLNITLTNSDIPEHSNGTTTSSTESHMTTDDWRFPFVAYSPAGIVEGGLVYGHYGRESDLLLLQSLRISLKQRIVLLRLGKLSLAEKVKIVETAGAGGVLVYWDSEDAPDNVDYPSNASFIPYAAAVTYTTDSGHLLVPSIPVQTVSTTIAESLLQLLAQETATVKAPSFWTGKLNVPYTLGRKGNDGNLTVRLTSYNKEKHITVTNIISNIHGMVDRDRYVVVGAPRASLPGVTTDATTSTVLLMQLARSLKTAHRHKENWKPRRGIRLVSWGGSDIGNIGLLKHIMTRRHLLSQRAVAYFDINQLVLGKDVLTARMSPGFYQVIKEVTTWVPDPSDNQHSIQSAWQLVRNKTEAPGSVAVPLVSYHGDRSTAPFLHITGVPTISLQYKNKHKMINSSLTVAANLVEDSIHHYKYHEAVIHVLVWTMLAIVDNDIIPYSLDSVMNELGITLGHTSHLLEECSSAMQDLDESINLFKQLEQTAKVFEDYIDVYRENEDINAFRMVNDIKMLFERLFLVQHKGIPYHILYPFEVDGTISEVFEMCQAGEFADVRDHMEEFSETMQTILTEATAALRAAN